MNNAEISNTYKSEKKFFIARLRRAGRTVEEAEDLFHDVFTEAIEKIPRVPGIHNLAGWLNTLFTRRLIDDWRKKQRTMKSEQNDIATQTLEEIIVSIGLNPLEEYVKENLIEALNDALKSLPVAQRQVIEAQVFGGRTFQQIADYTGDSIDTLMARKRYGLQKLSYALRHWIET